MIRTTITANRRTGRGIRLPGVLVALVLAASVAAGAIADRPAHTEAGIRWKRVVHEATSGS